MAQSQFGKYIKRLTFIVPSLLILGAGLNWLIDPYAIYGSPKITGLNALKPEVVTHSRMAKAYAMQHIRPKAIILGTSAAEWGIDPGHKGWSFEPVYNLGLPSANVYEMLRYLQHTNNIQPLKQVLLGLDFVSFNSHSLGTDYATEARLSVTYNGQQNSSSGRINEIVATLFSLDALGSSLSTVRQDKNTYRYKENGMYEFVEQDLRALGGYREIFMLDLAGYAKDTSLRDAFQFGNLESDRAPFTYYRRILQIAYRDGIDLRMVISPAHVHLWEVLAAAGLWPNSEEWKRALVTINEAEAQRSGQKPFPLWDFSDYNEFTTEAVPGRGDTQTAMRWYVDPRHYKKDLGDLMLDRVFGLHDPERLVPDGFGLLLNSTNIDGYLQQIRSERQRYRDTHPSDIADIEKLF